jgi:hypothetical protein
MSITVRCLIPPFTAQHQEAISRQLADAHNGYRSKLE